MGDSNIFLKFFSLKIKIIALSIMISILLFASTSYMIFNVGDSKNKTFKKQQKQQDDIAYLENAIFPLPVQYQTLTITGVFGYRNCPFHGQELHGGLDLVGADGSDIINVYDGEVVVSMLSSSYGNTVVVKHNIDINSDGNMEIVYTRYAHMKETPFVSVGDVISRGTILGHQGSTGNSTGSHLHFELSVDNYFSGKIDPAEFLGLAGITKGSTVTNPNELNINE